MKKFMVAAIFASMTLTACGGGGGGDDSGSNPPTPNPAPKGKIAFTPVNDVSAIVGSQVSVLATAKWTGSYANTEVDFVANEFRALSAPVVMAVVN